mmetsp:Transcript_66224/g.144367  ORF Transcript_66224/g.144367 Transcript_66224/m.144367 type:complete len:239 (-) Transcript_66224:1022-1738(-)
MTRVVFPRRIDAPPPDEALGSGLAEGDDVARLEVQLTQPVAVWQRLADQVEAPRIVGQSLSHHPGGFRLLSAAPGGQGDAGPPGVIPAHVADSVRERGEGVVRSRAQTKAPADPHTIVVGGSWTHPEELLSEGVEPAKALFQKWRAALAQSPSLAHLPVEQGIHTDDAAGLCRPGAAPDVAQAPGKLALDDNFVHGSRRRRQLCLLRTTIRQQQQLLSQDFPQDLAHQAYLPLATVHL